MPQAILPRTPNSSCFGEEDKKSEVHIDDYQVDSISVSSNQQNEEDEETEAEDDFVADNAIVVNNKPHLPHFGSVSVVNSNDVHFGNKTVYKGPVTIKQFVYPNSDLNSDPELGLNGLVKKSEVNCEDEFVQENKDQPSADIFNNKSEEGEQEANSIRKRLRTGFKWIKTVPCKKRKETLLLLVILLISITTVSSILIWKNPSKPKNTENPANEDDIVPIDYTSDSEAVQGKLRMVNRLLWLAQPPSGPINILKVPVSLVIIAHTATTNCSSQAQCVFQTRQIQTFHMESFGWNDIGYNFLVGGDGAVYEGRGWKSEGAHTFGWNNISMGVAFIGTYNSEVPPPNMLTAFGKLMEKGVELGYLTKEYVVMAARQFSGTESPGKAFYEIIKTWTHWSELKH